MHEKTGHDNKGMSGHGFTFPVGGSVPFSYPEPFLRAVNGARQGALAKSKPDTIKTWYPVKHCACSTSNADKHFGFLVCFVLKVFLQENPTKAVGFANFIYLNQLVGKT